MTETRKTIWCDHGGNGRAPVVIDVWACHADGRGWGSLAHETKGDADAVHQLEIMYAEAVGHNVDAHLDHAGKNRHIGGVNRTRRGWQLTCPCGRSPRVRHHRMVTLMQDLARRGQPGIELASLDTPTQHPTPPTAI